MAASELDAAPKTQTMAAAGDSEDRRGEHVARVDTSSGACFCCTSPLASLLWWMGPAWFFPCAACKVLQPREAAVATVYGQYVGTWQRAGLYCVNPCGLEWRTVSVNNRVADLKSLKCADAAGSSLLVSGVITFRVHDAARAVLDMRDVDSYVHLQAQAVLKKVASQYRYITYDGSPSLMTEAAHMGEQLRLQLQELVAVAGVRVVSFGLSDLAYAPEIAGAMLVRQQAQATLDARKLITGGAVGIACDALDELAVRGRQVAPADASRFVSNLVMIIAAERAPMPTIEV